VATTRPATRPVNATYLVYLLNVCSGVKSKQLFPGDQLWQYALNPGEGFAEAYRVLNRQQFGIDQLDWPISHRRCMPTSAALEAIRADVLRPWTAATDVRRTGRLDAKGRATVALSTPLDGALVLSVEGATIGGSDTARRTVCGARRTSVTLAGRAGSRFVLIGSRP
jgi:hypothetical protein